MSDPNERFICVHKQLNGSFGASETVKIVVDRETGVQYLWYASKIMNAGMGGLTVLVDQNGKPLLYKESNE